MKTMYRLLNIVALMSLAIVSVAQLQTEKQRTLIDLTLPAPQDLTSTGRGVPAFSNKLPVTLLPLTLRVVSIQRRANTGAPGVVLLLAIQNLSDKDFLVPVGRDVQEITADNRTDRTTLAFLIRALCDKCDRKELRTVAITASANSLPDSHIKLKSGEHVFFKLFVDTNQYPVAPSDRALDLQLGCQEIELEDGKYAIKSRSTIAWLDFSIPHVEQYQTPKAK